MAPFIAELRRPKGPPSVAPFLRIFGNPSSQVNLVMTSAYERANVRPFVQTLGEGEGSLAITLTGELKNAILSCRDL